MLADRDEWVRADYEKVIRDLNATHARAAELERELAVARRAHADALEAHAAQEAAAAAARAELDRGSRTRRQHEIARRASFSWWLALPLRRAWLALTGKPPWS